MCVDRWTCLATSFIRYLFPPPIPSFLFHFFLPFGNPSFLLFACCSLWISTHFLFTPLEMVYHWLLNMFTVGLPAVPVLKYCFSSSGMYSRDLSTNDTRREVGNLNLSNFGVKSVVRAFTFPIEDRTRVNRLNQLSLHSRNQVPVIAKHILDWPDHRCVFPTSSFITTHDWNCQVTHFCSVADEISPESESNLS